MNNIKAEIIDLLNQALKLEQASRIQYLAHAEQITGLNAEALIARFHELAADEAKHEKKLRTLIADYLGGTPSMELAETHAGKNIQEILNMNIQDEKYAVEFYKTIYEKVLANKEQFPYEFETLEHVLRHIIIDEQEHLVELKILAG